MCKWSVRAPCDHRPRVASYLADRGAEREWSPYGRTVVLSVVHRRPGALDDRAERPVSRRDERWFHPLSGLGDQAFGAYLAESGTRGSGIPSPARVVVRTGTALISVTYGAKQGDGAEGDSIPPLTREEAVNGAYAVARSALRAVRR